MKKSVIIFMCMIMCGCAGNYVTRVEPIDGHFFGAYPYESLAADYMLATHIGGSGDQSNSGSYSNGSSTWAVLGLLSFPGDIIIDTIILPVDLVLWPFGFKKGEW